MTMKAKVIDVTNPRDLQGKIDEWLEQEQNIVIQQVSQSQSQHGQMSQVMITVCIWYTEGLPKKV